MSIDTHAHLDDKQFDNDREEVIARAFESGVKKIINIGAGLGSSRRSVELAENPPVGGENIFAAVGFHPHCFSRKEFSIFNFQFSINFQFFNFKLRKNIKKIRELAKKEKVVAIGEIGLDYYFHETYSKKRMAKVKKKQKKGFIAQLNLARELNLPVIIHCRGVKSAGADHASSDAYDDCYEIIKKYLDLKFVFHCYGGNRKFTEKLLQHKNISFSFTGNITYAKTRSEIIEIIRIIPIDKIMLETDCPYLAPAPMRGKRNEPLFVRYVEKKIAELKNINEKDAERVADENASRFFKFVL